MIENKIEKLILFSNNDEYIDKICPHFCIDSSRDSRS